MLYGEEIKQLVLEKGTEALIWSKKSLLIFLSIIFISSLISCSKSSETNKEAQTATLKEVVKHDTVLGTQEVILEKVSKRTTYEDEEPKNDFFLVAEISFKNIGEEAVPFVTYADRLWLNRHAADFAMYSPMEQAIQPNETSTIEAVFDSTEANTYNLTFIFGLHEEYDITWDIKQADVE